MNKQITHQEYKDALLIVNLYRLQVEQNLKDILSAYNRNLQINDAQLQEAKRILPKAGYNNNDLYVVPTYGIYQSNGVLSDKLDQPAPPVSRRRLPERGLDRLLRIQLQPDRAELRPDRAAVRHLPRRQHDYAGLPVRHQQP